MLAPAADRRGVQLVELLAEVVLDQGHHLALVLAAHAVEAVVARVPPPAGKREAPLERTVGNAAMDIVVAVLVGLLAVITVTAACADARSV